MSHRADSALRFGMRDPWLYCLDALNGMHPTPPAWWPADRVRVFIGIGPDLEPDLELPPETTPEISGVLAVDEVILEHLDAVGPVRVRVAAAGLGLSKSTLSRTLIRLRSQGRVELRAEGWLPA